MKVHLVFPPVWLTEIPYLSVPILRAYLNQIANVQTRSLDLNVAFWSHLRSESSLAQLLSWARRKLNDYRVIRSRRDLDAVLRLRAIASYNVESLIAKTHDGTIPTSVLLSCIKMHFAEDVLGEPVNAPPQGWQHDRVFHDPYLNSISLSHLATTSETLLRSLDIGDARNPFLRLMPTLYRHVVGDELPNLLGVSVTAVNQVVPALALSKWLRLVKPDCRIVWGGQWVTHVLDRPQELAPLFHVIDAMVAGEGELPLAKLVTLQIENKDWANVPNVFRKVGAKVAAPSDWFDNRDLNHLPAPDFEGIPLDAFDHPHTLPLQTSRGCSWRHCRFCSYVTLDPVYKTRDIGRVGDDIQAIVSRHPVREIAFTDAIMEPSRFLAISDEILSRGIRVTWRGFGRFDRRFTREDFRRMAEAGCRFIIWGMESGSDRILNLMRKGTTRAIATANLRDAALAGIHNRVCLIYGYPSETDEDRELTISLVRENLGAIHSMAFSPLSLERGTPLTHATEVQLMDGLSPETGLELQLPRTLSCSTLAYLRETEQRLRHIHLELERR